MARVADYINTKITVEPKDPFGGMGRGFLTWDDLNSAYKSRIEEMAEQIKRHVDGVRYVELEPDFACGHCHRAWTEDSATYNGGCCDLDEESNPHPDVEATAASALLSTMEE